MKVSILALFTALGSIAFANPVPAAEANPSDSVEKRTVGGVFFCSDAGFQGDCGYAVQPLNTCIPITAPWDTDLSSIGPDEGTGVIIWPVPGCPPNDGGWTFTYPGSDNLQRDSPYNDNVKSMWVFAT
ncbi:hypothetical protein F5884DRAFT_754822 [Xylogone sp. PMI_703]|nr:hypothetical protein F5884DRAFT_754822 [Xylogone sp. PMI_703]